jgi:hypothetical protein
VPTVASPSGDGGSDSKAALASLRIIRCPPTWTASRIANRLHRDILAPHGFTRAGQTCERIDGGLRRAISVHTRTQGARPSIQILVQVMLHGLPERATDHRCDGLSGTAETPAGRRFYPLPASAEPLPADLLADVAGPILDFLVQAQSLEEFILWAQEIFAGDTHPGWWRQFCPVIPQGTGPLQAAAYAAALLDDSELVEFLTARIENEEPDTHRLDAFVTELRRLGPGTCL